MDRFTRDIVNRKVGKGIPALLVLASLLAGAGCQGGRHAMSPPPGNGERAADNAAPAPAQEWLPPVVKIEPPREAAGAPATDNAAQDNAVIGASADGHGRPGAGEGGDASRVPGPSAPPAVRPTPEAASPAAIPAAGEKRGGDASLPRVSGEGSLAPHPAGTAPGMASRANGTPSTHKTKPAAAPQPVPTAPHKDAHGASIPGWAKSPEELVYRVDFIGITMGYARFRYKGRVSIAGKPAFHLNVRAWTSGVLSFIFPINETIDYYLDTETLAPIRQEFTERQKEKDDVALYNQETGRITYRYRQSGKIRKQVDTVPSIYDPVSVAYYFRWRDLGVESRARNVYGGRKIYQISSRVLGYERIHTEHGEVDTIAVLPLIRRNGKPDDKGDLKVWFSNDERRVPVRLYAKFHKIKDWTLVGELMPQASKAGG